MCGIFFSIGFENLSSQVIDCVTHRGPDGQGWKVLSHHMVLSLWHIVVFQLLIFLRTGINQCHHKIVDMDVYNGEIYNYLERERNLRFKAIFQTQI